MTADHNDILHKCMDDVRIIHICSAANQEIDTIKGKQNKMFTLHVVNRGFMKAK